MARLTTIIKTNIQLVKDLAKKSFPNNPILADMTAVQAILEAGLRRSPPSKLAYEHNNLFGIKGKGTAGSVNMMTHEWSEKTGMVEIMQPFAKNISVEDSFAQHNKLFDLPRYQNLKMAKTFEEAARLIRLDGYATDPNYTLLLIEVYNQYVKIV